jgi:hypothetical protein
MMKSEDQNAGKVGKLRSLADLEQEIQPSRDLWPSIAVVIASDRRRSAFNVRNVVRPLQWHWMPWTVLASLSLGIASWTMAPRWMGRPGQPELSAVRSALLADQMYVNERDSLAAQTPTLIARLPKDAQASATDSLAAIRKTRADIEAAIRRDPGNPLLHQWLIGSYQEEIRAMITIREANIRLRAVQS